MGRVVSVKIGQMLLCVVSVLMLISLFGCAQQQKFSCEEPNVMVGSSCCVDDDSDDVCDTKEPKPEPVETADDLPAVEEVGPSEAETFASTLASAWSGKSYTALHSLFDKDLRLKITAHEFNFLARKMHSNLDITSVIFDKVDGNDAYYEVTEGDVARTVVAPMVIEDGEYKHQAFDFFIDIDAKIACADDPQCFFDFAKITGNRNYCESAGELRADCLEELGVAKTLTMKIDECKAMADYYGRVECLEGVAVKENTVEPCWDAEYDKQTFMCMGLVVAKRGDVEQCSEVISSRGFPGNRLQYTYCILRFVQETGDTDNCAKIDRRDDVVLGSLQEGCYRMNFP
jgi:hypothetical protein